MPIRYEEIERAKHSPVVYFVQNGDRIKIGTTQCVTERIGNLSLRPDDIRLILHGGRGFEQDMHELFEADRIGTTEWFTVSPEIMSFVRARTGQPFPHQTPGTTVTRIRPRPAPRPAPVLSPRPVSPAQPSRPVLTTGTAGRFTGQGAPSMSSRALSLFEDGLPEDKVRDTLRAEYLSPDGTPPKANTINKAVTRAKDKLSLRP